MSILGLQILELLQTDEEYFPGPRVDSDRLRAGCSDGPSRYESSSWDTFVPHIQFDKEFLAMVVAVIGATLSAYLYTSQSNEEVEEEKAAGRASLAAPDRSLVGALSPRRLVWHVLLEHRHVLRHPRNGFNAVSARRHEHRQRRPSDALSRSLGGKGGGAPVLARHHWRRISRRAGDDRRPAYDLCQTIGWKYGLDKRPKHAKRFYGAISVFTAVAIAMNFIGVNPMKALVVAELCRVSRRLRWCY